MKRKQVISELKDWDSTIDIPFDGPDWLRGYKFGIRAAISTAIELLEEK